MMHAGAPANAILRSLDAVSLRELGCVPVTVEPGQFIHQSGAPELHAYFPVTAVVSIVSTMATGESVEAATVGHEGMVGLAGVLTSADGTSDNVVQVGGICMRTTTAAVRAARARNAAVRSALDRYTTARLIQVSRIAACNRLHPIGHRLARWLLCIHDRADGDTFRLRQQIIADMLGVHRPTIALELQRLHVAGAIRYGGRLVTIANRAQLAGAACECHEVLNREYVSLLRWSQDSETIADDAIPEMDLAGDADIETVREMAGRLLMVSIREQEARERAEAAGRAKDDFLALVSHELRAPMQAILGWCALGKKADVAEQAMAVIERNARAQLRLVEDLLDSARISAETLSIVPAVVDPKSVLEAAIETVRPTAEAKHVTVRMKVSDELSPLIADADRLRQVLVNVLMNSVKFTEAGGSIDADVSSTTESVEVQVRDTGRGISAQVLPHVFERFRQGDQRGSRGLGLGLSIARALVELHGGTIQMTSPGEGQGATCTISLPTSSVAIASS
ncbi:MAG TPA: ATP-binding protein [Vicinamibacterales bacterium]|nr:ATP-binding protein [Vicinamibacterales bacterium]